jgi:hypothetical protein
MRARRRAPAATRPTTAAASTAPTRTATRRRTRKTRRRRRRRATTTAATAEMTVTRPRPTTSELIARLSGQAAGRYHQRRARKYILSITAINAQDIVAACGVARARVHAGEVL